MGLFSFLAPVAGSILSSVGGLVSGIGGGHSSQPQPQTQYVPPPTDVPSATEVFLKKWGWWIAGGVVVVVGVILVVVNGKKKTW